MLETSSLIFIILFEWEEYQTFTLLYLPAALNITLLEDRFLQPIQTLQLSSKFQVARKLLPIFVRLAQGGREGWNQGK